MKPEDYLPFCRQPWNGGVRVGERVYPCCYMPAYLAGKPEATSELQQNYGLGLPYDGDLLEKYNSPGFWRFRDDLINGNAGKFCGPCVIAKSHYEQSRLAVRPAGTSGEDAALPFVGAELLLPFPLPLKHAYALLDLWLGDPTLQRDFPVATIDGWMELLAWIKLYGDKALPQPMGSILAKGVGRPMRRHWRGNRTDPAITEYMAAIWRRNPELRSRYDFNSIDGQRQFHADFRPKQMGLNRARA